VIDCLLELSSVVKDYRALRPLRIERFTLHPGEQLAIVGIDQPAAEVLINLLTGAALPDSGTVNLFGQSSASIADGTEWLAMVDRFGIVSLRAVLLEGLSVAQNLAVPFSLDIEPLPDALREQAVRSGREVGLAEHQWDAPVMTIGPAARLRLRLARALALDPAVVLLEHPSADVARDEVALLGRDIRSVLERRGAAGLTLTADPDFAAAVAGRVLLSDPSTGRLAERRRGWFGLRQS
jgi:ABC-type transporter Mla maintaining outer membrane lipid asymmetry ATPase subunit MlaF